MLKEQIIDQYTFLDYKETFGASFLDGMIENWVGSENLRRLNAYKMYESYYRNNARLWLNTEDEEVKAARREYGDPHVVVETVLSSLLGEDQSIQVEDVDGTANNDSPAAQFQKKLVEWAGKERLFVKMTACERKAVTLGDGIYVLGWNEKLNRPRLTVWDPGFYFPVWDEEDPSQEFPSTIHIAYDFMRDNEKGEQEKYLRRITWQLVDLVDEETDEPASVSDRDWNGGQPVEQTVLYSDHTWKYDSVGQDDEGQVYTLNLNSVYQTRADRVDLEIDWIPVIHISNTDTDSGEHWGISTLAPIMQIVDDMISTDTDLQAASATTGSPPLVIPDLVADIGEDKSIRSYGPGEVFATSGDATGAHMIDTSNSLVALSGYCKDLLSRMSVNGRIPESLLGRVKPNEVPSGIALTLSFSPHSAMIREMRQVRQNKYQLLLKMVGRLYQQNGDVKEVFPASIFFGTFLPADRQETMTLIIGLYTAKAISMETAVRMLVEAGFPIESIEQEINLIIQRDYAGAAEMLGVTGNVNDALKLLGLPPVTVQPQQDPTQNDTVNPDGDTTFD